jgi:hypothetical protein
MARLLDTLSGFEAFARKAGLETPYMRESLWMDKYEGAYREVFDGFYAAAGDPAGRAAVVRELARLRPRVEEAAPVVRQAINDVEAAMPSLLGVPPEPSPLHVLMVGTLSTNATVGRVGDEVAVFHCLEWFQSPEGTRVLVAHETTHAWHELKLGRKPPEDDAAWVAFSEGVAIAASRALVPDRPELDYFWYGHPGVESWLPWCQERRGDLFEHFRAALDVSDTVETYFGGGTIEGQWRVGYYLADELVKNLGRSLPELVAMSVEEAQAAIRQELGADPARPPAAH